VGGFVEVNSTTMPGLYRLDLPDAAFVSGADDVSVMIKTGVGTDGVMLSIKLSEHVHSINEISEGVWSNSLSTHTTATDAGGILAETHNLASSIDLVVNTLPTNPYTQVFVGRFDLRQTGSETVDTIEVFTTDTPSFELQLTDRDGNEVPVTSATLGLRILDVASTVVETGTPTVEYGTGGIVRWTGPGTFLAIGCPVGMYRLFIDRTVSGTTTTFGPLQIKVQAQ
jgi:hypothetical protein